MRRPAIIVSLLAALVSASPAGGQGISPDSARALNHQLVRKECDEGRGRYLFDCDRLLVSYRAAEAAAQGRAYGTQQTQLDEMCGRISAPQRFDARTMTQLRRQFADAPADACAAATWWKAGKRPTDLVMRSDQVMMMLSRDVSFRDPAKIRAHHLGRCDAQNTDCACFAQVHVTMLTDSIAKRELSSETDVEIGSQALQRCRKPE